MELSDFDKKVCNAYKIELQKENKNKYKIEKLAKIIEDKEDFVLLGCVGLKVILETII